VPTNNPKASPFLLDLAIKTRITIETRTVLEVARNLKKNSQFLTPY
jgi:hypothetical protein